MSLLLLLLLLLRLLALILIPRGWWGSVLLTVLLWWVLVVEDVLARGRLAGEGLTSPSSSLTLLSGGHLPLLGLPLLPRHLLLGDLLSVRLCWSSVHVVLIVVVL